MQIVKNKSILSFGISLSQIDHANISYHLISKCGSNRKYLRTIKGDKEVGQKIPSYFDSGDTVTRSLSAETFYSTAVPDKQNVVPGTLSRVPTMARRKIGAALISPRSSWQLPRGAARQPSLSPTTMPPVPTHPIPCHLANDLFLPLPDRRFFSSRRDTRTVLCPRDRSREIIDGKEISFTLGYREIMFS